MFKLVEKSRHISKLSPTQISVAKTSLTFGSEISSTLESHVEIYTDREENRVGFKSTTNEMTGFKVQQKNAGDNFMLTKNQFMGKVSQGIYDATFKEGMWVIDVDEIAFK